MIEHLREITREEFETVKRENKIPTEMVEKYIEKHLILGYGLYGMRVYEKDGKHYLWFETGDSCE